MKVRYCSARLQTNLLVLIAAALSQLANEGVKDTHCDFMYLLWVSCGSKHLLA
jgi:hypothetical protein